MRRLLLMLIILVVALSPVYSAQGLAITYGETTYSNQAYKDSMYNYFQSHSDKDLKDATYRVITASEVNAISKDITGRNYKSNQIFSCALVDLSYSQGIKIIVDTSKVTTVTSRMYATALKSSGIENGYVVVSSPTVATGESALAGVLKSYEIAVGTSIPDEAKKAATEELYVETRVVNQTGQNPDTIAELFDKTKEEVQKQKLEDPSQIKIIVINMANNMNINLSDQQAQQIADAISNSQKAQGNLTEFKNQLQQATQQASEAQGILAQITAFLENLFNYLQGLLGQ
ncbi:DUF1002 domain-containing protein [Methanobacterium sp. CWC-01]|uniref:DUF1002 domain-containing protein n=1 Tax=Methanobacterium aridiramus TaxID=2584467 RepID=UPI002577EE2D|nr:DUF1002 domain-containing protein [Methanobacterium sp. CWC-01]WJI09318.1 DUF1002 domain-containing protein [Methanobacterium sp. CWC-01]